jgi:hypothetical protein
MGVILCEGATAAGIEEPPRPGGCRSFLYQRRATVYMRNHAPDLFRIYEVAQIYLAGFARNAQRRQEK